MPEGGGKEADPYGDSRADFGEVEGEAWRQVIGQVRQHALVEKQSQDKDAQFKHGGSHVKEEFQRASPAKEDRTSDIEKNQEACDPERKCYECMC